MSSGTLDIISPEAAENLHGLFRERVKRTPNAVAYRYFDKTRNTWSSINWKETQTQVSRWQYALRNEALEQGDRVAVLLQNCKEWVIFEQAALSLGLVVVPLYLDDRSDNIAYILNDSGARLLLINGPEQWQKLYGIHDDISQLERIVCMQDMTGQPHDARLREVSSWLPAVNTELQSHEIDGTGLATIVYTSGTTGKPKGVKLTHDNILYNAWYGLQSVSVYREDLFLSFLPLSHMLERTVGLYIPIMTGSAVAHARSIDDLADDLLAVRPTILVSVPRIFERVYNRINSQLEHKSSFARMLFHRAVNSGWKSFLYKQGRGGFGASMLLNPLFRALVGRKIMARLGGRMRLAICGGAALPPKVAQTFIGLGLELLQGYGLTETSPVISVNTPASNYPDSVGMPCGDIEVKVSKDGELLTRSVCVMEGYWDAATEIIDEDGWLHTGDKVEIRHGHIFITGRLKDIIVMSNGEKVPPADIEMAIASDPLFEQIMVIGEGRPYLSALLVVNPEVWREVCLEHDFREDDISNIRSHDDLHAFLVERISVQMREFPGYIRIKQADVIEEPWSIENGMLTPTMKVKRNQVLEKYHDRIEALYEGH
jgi:long-chain acyl-CoA synthetase